MMNCIEHAYTYTYTYSESCMYIHKVFIYVLQVLMNWRLKGKDELYFPVIKNYTIVGLTC